ncbi:MAG TPA: M48 family metalloprotease [Solirubrobacteraceae bacterium]|nr:M48 family metalloprotease [Solirubrobacteraceae bacterium]
MWDSTTVPENLVFPHLRAQSFFTQAELDRAANYDVVVHLLAVWADVVLVGVLVLYARRGARLVRESAAGRIGTGFLLGMLGFALVWIAQLPFGLAELWWARDHHLSNVGYVEYAIGSWLALGGQFLFICLAILIVMGLAGVTRRLWWIAAAPVFVALSGVLTFVSPYLLPNLRPLDVSALAADAARYARVEGVHGVSVQVEDVHQLTTQPNAEATGLGPTKRVILWDTLLDSRFSRREVDAVLAHELGHLAHHHLWKRLGWSALFAFPFALLVALATRRRGGMYEPTAVPVALLVFVAVHLALLPAQNAISRHMEAEADWSSLQATRDPAATRALFVELARVSRADPRPYTFDKLFSADHPAILDRIGMVEAWQTWQARSGGR